MTHLQLQMIQVAAAVSAASGSSILYFITKRDFYSASFSSAESVAFNKDVRKHNAMVKKVRPWGFALVLVAVAVQVALVFLKP